MDREYAIVAAECERLQDEVLAYHRRGEPVPADLMARCETAYRATFPAYRRALARLGRAG